MKIKNKFKIEKIWDNIFKVSILIKFIDGIIEIISAFILFFVNSEVITKIILKILGNEISENPRDFLIEKIIQAFSTSQYQAFFAMYFLINGLIKIGLVVLIWKKKLWAYPLATIILTLFILYQIYTIIHTHSILQIILTIADIVILTLLRFEYKRATKLKHIIEK